MKKRKIIYISAFLLLFFFSIFRIYSGSFVVLDKLFSYIAYPVLAAESIVINPVKAAWHNWQSYDEIKCLLAEYRQKFEELQAQNIVLQESLKLQEETKELTEFARNYNTDQARLSQILFKHFDDTHHFFLLDAGANKHIKPNMVVVYRNCLIGRVSEVYPCYCKVTLITDRTCKIAAHCSLTGIRGIYQGNNTLTTTQLTFVNHLDKIKEHELVISSGDGLVFPRGFGLGRIKNCKLDEFNYVIEVEPLLDLERLTYCYIIEKGADVTLPANN
jgi:rod shape-determining protein MreC